MANPAQSASSRKRRSTRVTQSVILTATGIDSQGKPFKEQSGTLTLSFHGCRYFSRHAVAANSWLQMSCAAHRFRARVVSVIKSGKLKGLFQVSVEIETPGNVWGLASPPEDWRPQPAAAPPPAETAKREDAVPASFEREMKACAALAATGNYYQLLHVTSNSTPAQIKRSFYELARKFHPDHHMEHSERMEPLHRLMDTITLAYKTLTDETARQSYDQQLTRAGAFQLGRGRSDLEKSAEEYLEKARESFRDKNFGGAIVWLRKALDLEPQSPKYHALLARSLAAVPQYRREAAEHYEQAILGNSASTEIRFQLAELYEAMKLPWRAQAQYEKILKLDASHSKARERLKALNAAAGKKDGAATNFMNRLFHRSST